MPSKALIEQEIQDNAYDFPYHYVAQYRKTFTQTINDTWGICYVSTIEFLLKMLAQDDLNSIADVGTGDGRLVKEMSKGLNVKTITGIDYSAKAIKLAVALNPNLDFKCLDITENIVTDKYDAITLIEVFEHIPIDLTQRFIDGLVRMLNKNGYIYLTVPHINRAIDMRHFQHFTAEKISQYFDDYFHIEKVVYFEQEDRFLLKIMHKIMTNNIWRIQV